MRRRAARVGTVCSRLGSGLIGAALSCGCFPSGPDFEPPQRLTGVRVLAVEASPASGVPGAPVDLRLEVFDALQHPLAARAGADSGADAEPVEPLSIVWLGGCHNPPGDAHFGCEPLLARAASALPGPLPTRGGDIPPGEREFWGVGSRFATPIPNDILEGRELDTNAPAFGVSFVFFAVCRGTLFPDPSARGGAPLRCEAATGERVGSDGFVRGFATIYTYAGSVNRAPLIDARLTDGVDFEPTECSSDADCAPFATESFGSACRSPVDVRIAGEEEQETKPRCLPSVPACVAPPCRVHQLRPLLSPGGVEPDPSAAAPGSSPPREIVWVKYYGLGRTLEAEALINDRASGLQQRYGTGWVAPARASEAPLPVWAVVQDNRGGTSVVRWDFVVTP